LAEESLAAVVVRLLRQSLEELRDLGLRCLGAPGRALALPSLLTAVAAAKTAAMTAAGAHEGDPVAAGDLRN
jgi:hypothetical protein